MIRSAIYIVGIVGGVMALVAVIGAALPRRHSASRTARLPVPPDTVYALLADVDRHASWRTTLKSLERLPDRNGLPAWVETTGTQRISLCFERMERPGLLVSRITDESLPFGGTWTYRIAAVPDGSDLTITEDGEIRNTIFRFMARFVFGYTATMDGFLKSVERAAEGRRAIGEKR
jgi:uncharacterized protein YndB with AHSA1/START domain